MLHVAFLSFAEVLWNLPPPQALRISIETVNEREAPGTMGRRKTERETPGHEAAL